MAVSDPQNSSQYRKSVFANFLTQGFPRSPGGYPSLMRKKKRGIGGLYLGKESGSDTMREIRLSDWRIEI